MGSRVFRFLRDMLDLDETGKAAGNVVAVNAAGDGYELVVPSGGGGGGGAPTTADYLVGSAQAGLSAEIVVGVTPGGELGGSWGAPTVDATHSGSSHAQVQAAAEATAAAGLTAHVAAADPHTGYQKESEKGAASGYAGLDAGGTVPDAQLPAGVARDAEVSAAITASEAGQVRDGDAAGGVLSGTYPNPGFATDMATQAELDAHLNDTTDAHDASAISILDTAADFTATDVEGALAELQSDAETDATNLANHLADATDAHDASAISFVPTGTIAATDVQAAIAEVASEAGGGGSGSKAYPVQLLNPRVSSLAGNAFWAVGALTDWDAGHWEFTKDVDGKIYGVVRVPPGYVSGGTVRLAVAANATTGVTRLGVGTKAVADGESLNPTLTDETKQDITVPATAYLRKDVTFTLTETLAADDLLLVEVFHEGSHANDTLAVNTLLLGAWLEVTAS